MGTFSKDEMKEILRRASQLQQFQQNSPAHNALQDLNDEDPIFTIGEEMDIDRKYIQEALLEYQGIQFDDPIAIDSGKNYMVETLGYANGILEGGAFNELRSQLEYYFNTPGKVSRRKNKVTWKANPSFPAKLFQIKKSPKLTLEQQPNRIKLRLEQNLKTLYKLLIPAGAFLFGAFMFFANLVIGEGVDDEFLMVGMSFMSIMATIIWLFVRRKKMRKKEQLLDLTESLQHTLERRFNASRSEKKQNEAPEISMEDLDEIHEDSNEQLEIEIETAAQRINS